MDENGILFSILYNEEIYAINESDKKDTSSDAEVENSQVHEHSGADVLIIVGDDFENEKAFFEKVIQSVKLKEGGYDLIKLGYHPEHETNKAISQHPCTKIILFGLISDIHLFEGLEYYVIENKGNQKILLANRLSEISADQDKKRKLWQELKLFFDL